MEERKNVIECRNLTHYYGKKLVYENLNISVGEGRILGLLGKNGAGKSTTINILNGFLAPRSGRCLIYGEDTQNLSPATKARIGYLIEGHIQYSFMNVHQIEKFYSGFYEKWDRDAYFNLINRLKILPRQKISTMSCGQRAQVALGLILAQDPDLLILDDFSLGLDPGYRRLFIDYLREYAKSGCKKDYLPSHIIQGTERLIVDILYMGYTRVLDKGPLADFQRDFKGFFFEAEGAFDLSGAPEVVNLERLNNHCELYTYASEEEIVALLQSRGVGFVNFRRENLTLEDAFIGLTGKY